MISTLSGRAHQVYTGVTIYSKDRNVTFVEKTDVYVKKLSEEEIRNYIKTNEGKDKAGSYAIQGEFNKYIKKANKIKKIKFYLHSPSVSANISYGNNISIAPIIATIKPIIKVTLKILLMLEEMFLHLLK